MLTVEMLEMTRLNKQLAEAKAASIHFGRPWAPRREPDTVTSGVWTNEMVNASLKDERPDLLVKNGLTAISDNEVFFYTDDYTYGTKVLPKEFCHGLHGFPSHAAPREGLEDGVIDSAEKMTLVYFHDQRQITSVEELVEYVNAKYYDTASV